MRFKKVLYIILGCIGLGLGAVGAVVPMLPAFPFARSSKRLHTWFVNTKLYKNNLESFVAGRGMTRTTKLRIMITITLLMAFGFTVMLLKSLYIPCMILGCVWVFHILYFVFGVHTIQE